MRCCVLGGVVLLGLACGPSVGRLSAASRSALDASGGTLDDRFVLTAKEFPGFAGLYVEGKSRHVVIRGTSKFEFSDYAKEYIFENFVKGRVLFVEGEENIEPTTDDLVFESAKLSFDVLKMYQLDIVEGLLRDRVAFNHVDADEVQNIVTILVPFGQAQLVESHLLSAGYPGLVFQVLESEKSERRLSLEDYVRPPAAGMQIALAGGGICTLGVNVLLPDGRDAFITASHCTRGGPGVVGEQGIPSSPVDRYIFQPVEVIGFNRIASEIVDPLLSTSVAGCPPSAAGGCRLTDSALLEYDGMPTGLYGTVARTVGRCTNPDLSCSTDEQGTGFSNTPLLIRNLVDRVDPLAGQVVEKTGRTTGHTFGSVTRSCMVTSDAFSPTDSLMLCNYSADIPSDHGDSGAPIYIGSGNVVWAAGILWGGPQDDFGTSFFTTLGDVATELGAFDINN